MCDTVQTDFFSSLSSPQGCVSGFLDAERLLFPPSYTRFRSQAEVLAYGRKIGVFPAVWESADEIIYCGSCTHGIPVPCTLVGETANEISVIEIEGNLHSVHPDHLAEMQFASNELSDLVRQCLTPQERDGCKLTVKPLKSPLTDDCWTNAGCKNIIINLSATPFHEVASATLCRYLRGSFYFQSRGKAGIVPLINCATPDTEKLQTLIHETLKTLFSFPAFGCCAFYEKCSDAKKCLHQDPFYSYACVYRKNLEAGKIFYGKNRTSEKVSTSHT